MNTPARRDQPDSPTVTPAAGALIESHPRWPLLITVLVMLALAGVASWLIPALGRGSAGEGVREGAEDVGPGAGVEAEEHR
ncbi:MAG: hypothetical protein R6X02_26960 [Enhygromyxa sp.]